MRYLDIHTRNFDESGEHHVVIDPLGRFVALTRTLGPSGAIDTIRPLIGRFTEELDANADNSAPAEAVAGAISRGLKALHRHLITPGAAHLPIRGLEVAGVLLKDGFAIHFGAGDASVWRSFEQSTLRLSAPSTAMRSYLGVRPPLGKVAVGARAVSAAVGEHFALLPSAFDAPSQLF